MILFVATMVWQFNPLEDGSEAIGPFIPWDYQVDSMLARPANEDDEANRGILWCYENKKTAVVQKSRDMGITWWFLILEVWLCLLHKYFKILNISKNADAVDCKDPDSLFWKVRFIHRWMPDWLKGEITDNSMLFEYKQSQSFLTGTPSTSAAGVGGRASVIFIDEYPRIKEDMAVRSGTASTSNARFFNGTHQGCSTEFFKLTQTPEVVQFIYHWSQHPKKNKGLYRWNVVKNRPDIIDTSYEFPENYKFDTSGKPDGGPYPGLRSPWYDNKVLVDIGSDVEAAQELDINPSGSVSQFFQPSIIRKLALEFCRRPDWVGDLVKDGSIYKLVEAQPGEEGPLKGGGWPLRFWMRPDQHGKFPEATYKIGADISGGTGTTNSCVSIFNADIGERIGEYVNPMIYPEHLAPLTVHLCKMMADEEGLTAELVWECHGPGVTFGLKVIEMGYRRVYWNISDIVANQFRNPAPKRPGWVSNPKSKKLLLSAYRFALMSRDFLNRSELAMEETLLFQLSPDGNKVFHSGELDKRDPSGAGENHGDRTIPDALVWMLSQGHAKIIKQQEPEGPPFGSVLWRREWHKKRAKRLERRR